MANGSAPGERRGGRRKGVRNKSSLKRERDLANDRKKVGGILAKDMLAEAMLHFRQMAAKYQSGGLTPDEKKFERYLAKAADIAKDLAPYESPKLQSTTLRGDSDGAAPPIKVQVEFV